jgi:hypothetical protein
MIRAIAMGRQPMPEDPVLRATVERLMTRYKAKKGAAVDLKADAKNGAAAADRSRDRARVLLGDHHPLRAGGQAPVKTFTPVDPAQWEFTKTAHEAARSQFYPGMWPGLPLEFTDLTKTVLDTRAGIDLRVTVGVRVPQWRAPVRFWVQERWRKRENYRFGDTTITRWNNNSDTESELHHFGAGILVHASGGRGKGVIDVHDNHLVDNDNVKLGRINFKFKSMK